MSQRIILRNGTAANWTLADPVLALAEIAIESDTGKFKVGDGVTAWTSLPYTSVAGSAQTTRYRSFGDGSDGDVTISSGTTAITRDMYYNNLTISGTGILQTNGFKLFVKNTLDLTNAGVGAIQANGTNGTNAAANVQGLGVAGYEAGTLAAQSVGGNGINGGTGAGSTGLTATLVPTAGIGASGGAGGAGADGQPPILGGSSGSASAITWGTFLHGPYTQFLRGITLIGGGAGGRGGSSGGGDGVNSGGGGGGGGGGAGIAPIYAYTILTSNSTSSKCIQAIGGNGGNGGNGTAGVVGGGGGAGAGGGGAIYIVYVNRAGPTISNMLDVSGGHGGRGGKGFGINPASGNAPQDGGPGDGAYAGIIYLYQVPTSTGKLIRPSPSSFYNAGVDITTSADATRLGINGGFGEQLFGDF